MIFPWVILSVLLVFTVFFLFGVFLFPHLKIERKNRELSLRAYSILTDIPGNGKITHNQFTIQPGRTTEDTRHKELFNRLQEYLLTDRNFAQTTLETEKLVAQLSTNRCYLFKAIKHNTGKTLQEYINTLRMEEAKRLLETTSLVVDDISMKCGYSSVRTFYRLFHSYYNMSPAMYRKLSGKDAK